MSLPLAIFLDMDGTLVDSESVGMQALRESSHKVLGKPFEEERFQRFLGRAESSFFAEMAEVFGQAEMEAIREGYREAYLPLLASLPALPGVREWMPRFAAIAPTLVVSGSTRAQIAAFLDAQGFTPHIRQILGCEDYAAGKPAPAPFLRAAESVAVDPARTLVLEDSDVGVQSALAAGCKVIGLRVGNPEGRYHLREAHLVLESLNDLSLEGIKQVMSA